VTTNTGIVCYDADFYPYGGERTVTNTCTQNAYKFEGKERDTETGNDDFGARSYSNRFGRWLSSDWSSVPAAIPYANLTNPQTLNLYSMVADDPESFADLDGHYMNAVTGDAGFGDPTFLGVLSGNVSDPAEPQAPQQQNQSQGQNQQNQQTKPVQQLTYETISGGSNSPSWVIQWKLLKKSEKGGWIVQEITDTDASGNQTKHFWEAWQVPANSQYTIYFPDRKDDTFVGFASGTKAKAEATFYEGLALPSSFKPNNSATPSGILPSTTVKPKLPTKTTTAPIDRTWTVP
jgi:RHS repeat-associated protein